MLPLSAGVAYLFSMYAKGSLLVGWVGGRREPSLDSVSAFFPFTVHIFDTQQKLQQNAY